MKILNVTLAALATAGFAFSAQADITLHGASQFGHGHPFNTSLEAFEKLTMENYKGDEKVKFVIHGNSELGLEKDYVAYMNQGISVDYAVFSPSHASTFSKMVGIMDMPFLYRDIPHQSKVLADKSVMKPLVDDLYKRADILILGYLGGGTRNLIVNKPVRNMAELKDLPIRVMGAPIQTKMFEAMGAAPTVIAYSEVYNAIQTGVIDAAENEAIGIKTMKFYEVGPHIGLTKHTITVRLLGIAGKTFRRLPKDLQDAMVEAGIPAGEAGRQQEINEGAQTLKDMEEKGWLTTYEFQDRDKLLEAVAPVRQEFAKEIGATEFLNFVDSVK